MVALALACRMRACTDATSAPLAAVSRYAESPKFGEVIQGIAICGWIVGREFERPLPCVGSACMHGTLHAHILFSSQTILRSSPLVLQRWGLAVPLPKFSPLLCFFVVVTAISVHAQ